MKTIGILACVAILVASVSIASAQSRYGYGVDTYSTRASSESRYGYRGGFGSGYGSTYTGDRSGGMSFGGM